jgi:superoxide dismutase, Cu-Zn family
MKRSFLITFGSLVALFIFAGCATQRGDSKNVNTAKPQGSKARPMAVAVLTPAPNSNVRGQVTFLQETEGIRVTANIEGLTPGKHGFHIHENGECTPPDFNSAGGHFNPTGARHGAPTDPEHHVGDFGNIEANQQGVARFERVFYWLTFSGTNSILNKAVIVHEKPDDLQSQPSGNAGARIACGIIKLTSH